MSTISGVQTEAPLPSTTNAADTVVDPAAAPVFTLLTLAPVLATADSPPNALDDLDVFADTPTSAASTPVSRRFQEDGDADMGGAPDAPNPRRQFKSDLQATARTQSQTKATPRSASRSRLPRPSSKKPTKTDKEKQKPDESSRRPRRQPGQTHTRASSAPVWSPQGGARLRASLGGKVQVTAPPAVGAQKQDVSPALLEYFECATKEGTTKHDGEQREMTTLEVATLFRWMDHQLHLLEPPRFLEETHTSAEQDAFADFDRDHLGFRLYTILPTGIKLMEGNPKYSLCHTALLSNAHDPATQVAVESMFMAAQVIKCDPHSRIAILRFISPEERDLWVGLRFKLGNGAVVMQATDSLTTDIPRAGLDTAARELLYYIYARGHSNIPRGLVRAFFAAAAKMAVFDAKSIESFGLTDFSGQKWMLAFSQVTCPTALAHVRRLEIMYKGETYSFDIQHPRAARREPCGKCLSVRHVTSGCKNAHAVYPRKAHAQDQRGSAGPTAQAHGGRFAG